MRFSSLLTAVALALAGQLIGTEEAQAGPAFGCTGDIYQVQSGQLRIFDPITSTYQNVGPKNSGYNATGFNVVDNFAYASQGQNIIRIMADGTIENVFNIGFGSYSGDLDTNNNYYLRRNNLSYAKIDLATGAISTLNFTGQNNGPADVAYLQNAGQEYLIGFSGGGRMHRYNITTGIKETISMPGLPGGAFGAAWTDTNGRLLTFNNKNGRLYEVEGYFTNTPTFFQVGIGDPSGSNDGFSCSQAPFPNLPPLAQDDAFSTPLNTAITQNVLPDNGNGVDEDPDGGAVSVNTVPITGPSNGSVTIASDGSFTYTPALNFIGVDSFVYQISDPTGLTAQATVEIDVTGTIDFEATKRQISGPSPVTAAGQVIGYEIVLENIGDIPLTGISVVDTLPNGSLASLGTPVEAGGTGITQAGRLDVDETFTYTTSYTVTQADIDAGLELVNAVSATSAETGATPHEDDATTPVSQLPGFSIVKDVDVPTTSSTGPLSYTITLTNTGNQTLTGPVLTDQISQGARVLSLDGAPVLSGDSDNDGALDVGETWIYAAQFSVTQMELDAGDDIVNLASFTTDQVGPLSDNATTSISAIPGLSVTKGSDTPSIAAPGLITYQIDVQNTGNVALNNVLLNDLLAQGPDARDLTSGPDLVSGDLDSDLILDVGETFRYVATYSVTQDDIDNGTTLVNNVAATTTEGATDTDNTFTTITQTPSFSLSKVVDTPVLIIPDTLNYTITVTNTGNVALTGVVFSDQLTQGGAGRSLNGVPTIAGDTDGDNALDVGEIWIFSAAYDVDQAGIDNGGDIVNTATFDANGVAAQMASATTTITQTDALGLAKSVASGEPTSFSAPGDQIDFTFIVENLGNTTVTGPITVDDDQIGNGLLCDAGNLLPGASVSCTFTWTADQADVNAGSVTNTATASGGAGITSPPAQATVTAVRTAALSIDKTIEAPLPTVFQSGEVLSYAYLVVNTGNVTITEPVTVTDNLTSVSCPALPIGGLLPQGSDPVGANNSITCTALYTIGTNDELLGSTNNVASAASSFEGNPVISPSDSAIFPLNAEPVLGLEKEAVPTGVTFAQVGDQITYTYTLTNQPPLSGIGATLTDDIFVDDDKIGAPFLCYDASVEGTLRVNESFTCSATYTVTQEDLDAGQVTNEAIAETIFAPASPSPVNLSSAPVTVTVPAQTGPALGLSKTVTAGPSPASVGDTLTYQIVATNTGNQTLFNATIEDPLVGALSCDLSAPVTLAPTAALTCTGTYEIKQADLNDQVVGDANPVIPNTAVARANDPAGDAVLPVEGSTDHPLTAAAPAISIVKELFPDPAANPAFSEVGDVLRFRMSVTNSGNVTLNTVAVTDDLIPGTCAIGTLAPGQSDQSCFFEYTVDQDDLDAGEVLNTGRVSAQPSDPAAAPVTASDDLASPGPAANGAIELTKSAVLDLGADGIATPGDVISYVFTIRNTGNVTLRDVFVTDAKADTLTYPSSRDLDGDQDIDVLARNTSVTISGTHAITQAEINAGIAVNTATVFGDDPNGTMISDVSDSSNLADGLGADDPTLTPITRTNGLEVIKTPSITSGASVGETITYSYLVRNTGNTDLTNVMLADQHTSATGTQALTLQNGGVIANLDAGDTATLTASYVVTQSDIDSGADITNVVDATATGPSGTTSPSAQDTASVAVETEAPALEVLKTVRSLEGQEPGDTIVFEITVRNAGNVSLTTPSLSDTLRRANGVEVLPAPSLIFESGDGGVAGQLDVGEVWTYATSHVLTQDDIDAGGINNSVTAQAQSPAGTVINDVSDNGAGDGNDATSIGIPSEPALQVVKTITSNTIELGQTVQFEITVQNTGNVTLSSVDIISDTLTRADGTVLALTSNPLFVGADAASPEGMLQVGETATYAASYVLTQADIDAGGIENTALATGSPPFGAAVSDVSDKSGAGSDPTVLVIPPDPVISLVKALADGSGPSFDAVGEVLDYTFSVTNEGNITLTNPLVVDDPLITDAGGTVICPTGDIAPGASVVCTGSYAITQADLDRGELANTATARIDGVPPATDDLTTPAIQLPAFELVKDADSLEAVDFVVGAEVGYTYTTTNTGNVTITSPISIDDNLIPMSDITCADFPAAGLAPGASYDCRGEYTVTGDDVLLGVVTNTATSSDGETVSPLVSESIPNDAIPALGIEKALTAAFNADLSPQSGLTFDQVGDILEYTFTVTNTGTQSFAGDVIVNDQLLADPVICFSPTVDNPDFISGEQTTCTGRYTVTQEDLDRGDVLNEAVAQTEFGTIPTVVTSAPGTALTPAQTAPALTLAKSVSPLGYTAIGETLTYAFEITNTGNQTLSFVSVTDPLLPGLVCDVDSLAPGASHSCAAPYTVMQEDIDRGFIENVAAANGLDPSGNAVPEAEGRATATGPSVPPTIAITKTASPSPFGGVGTSLTYRFKVENTSIYTLSNIRVTDALDDSYSCDISSLAPGAIDTSCFLVYGITQADLDEGSIINTAGVIGEDPFGDTANDSATLVTQGPPIDARIEATKLVDIPATSLGSVVEYTVLVENPGNRSLAFITLSDTMTRLDGSATALDAPLVFVGGDSNGDTLLTPGEQWSYTGRHTITQADINAGGFENSVLAEGTAPDPDGPVASDISDDGDDGDGNTEDDPTVVPITTDPVLVVEKTLVTSGAVAGDELVYRVTARNAGNVDITAVTRPVDTLLRADGTDVSSGVSVPVAVSGVDGLLSPAEEWAWEVRYSLVQADIDAGGLSNSVTVSGASPSGALVSDVSDDGNDADGNTQNDPTELTLLPAPALEVIKTLASPASVTAAGETLRFEVEAINRGNVTLSNFSATDTLTNFDGDPLSPVFEGVSGLTDGGLAPGDSAIFTYSYVVTQVDVDAGGVENTATVTADSPSGVAVSDISDDDGTGDSDPTRVEIAPDPSLTVTKSADVPTRQTDGSFVVKFTIGVTNAGNVTHRNLTVMDDLTQFLGGATLLETEITSVDGLTEGAANPAYDGVSDVDLLSAGAVLAVGDTVTIALGVTYDASSGDIGGENAVSVLSDRTLVASEARVAVTSLVEEPGIIATKTASPANPRRGDLITYTLTFENPLTTAEADLSLIDLLPVGLVYKEGSATLDGSTVPEPVRQGRRLVWSPVTIGPGETVEVRLQARLIAGAGRYVNEAFALGVSGDQVSNTATAVIEVRPEAVFDCSDVIGKVFDDLNGNGRQDGAHEPGLPRVRLATTRGTLITTDAHGRYSVPCAELPAEFGSNFTLKLDPRSLPSGYSVTTENPRVMRLTAGKLARMNFGARLGHVVEIDLMASAFERGKVEMSPRLRAALDQLLSDLRDNPTVLRLSYLRRTESLAGANARLDTVETYLRQSWRRRGRYRLVIERVVARIKEEAVQ